MYKKIFKIISIILIIELIIVLFALYTKYKANKPTEFKEETERRFKYGNIEIVELPLQEYLVCGKKLNGISVTHINVNYIQRIIDKINNNEFENDGGPTCKWFRAHDDGLGEGFPGSTDLDFRINRPMNPEETFGNSISIDTGDVFPRPVIDGKSYGLEVDLRTGEILYRESDPSIY